MTKRRGRWTLLHGVPNIGQTAANHSISTREGAGVTAVGGAPQGKHSSSVGSGTPVATHQTIEAVSPFLLVNACIDTEPRATSG